MDLVGGECPRNAVTNMNPKFISQKGQSLPSQVMALGAYRCLPRCGGLNQLWRD